jgi:hypothetical protein
MGNWVAGMARFGIHGFDIDALPIVSTSYKNVLNARQYQQA